jgi:YD repeat-containing protein
MEIDIVKLKSIIDRLLDHVIKTRGVQRVELGSDLYWDMSEEALYNVVDRPQELDIGRSRMTGSFSRRCWRKAPLRSLTSLLKLLHCCAGWVKCSVETWQRKAARRYICDSGTNQKGRLTQVTDASGSTSWAYDMLGRLPPATRSGTATRTARSRALRTRYAQATKPLRNSTAGGTEAAARFRSRVQTTYAR